MKICKLRAFNFKKFDFIEINFKENVNVLIGDMSIVGPRPPIPSEVKQYARNLTRRLSINPGITCIWQVSGRNNIPFDRWMEMDMEYIDNWSLTLDFIIILKTFKVFFVNNFGSKPIFNFLAKFHAFFGKQIWY